MAYDRVFDISLLGPDSAEKRRHYDMFVFLPMPLSFVQSIIVAIVGGVVSSVATVYIFRRQSKKEDAKAAALALTEKKETVRRLIEPLFQDLGTLIHQASQRNHQEVLAHLGTMNERQQRGEYHLDELPSVVFRNDWSNINMLFGVYRRTAERPAFLNDEIRGFMVSSVILPLARVLQNNLNHMRNGQL